MSTLSTGFAGLCIAFLLILRHMTDEVYHVTGRYISAVTMH
jgi:hypothetical protein